MHFNSLCGWFRMLALGCLLRCILVTALALAGSGWWCCVARGNRNDVLMLLSRQRNLSLSEMLSGALEFFVAFLHYVCSGLFRRLVLANDCCWLPFLGKGVVDIYWITSLKSVSVVACFAVVVSCLFFLPMFVVQNMLVVSRVSGHMRVFWHRNECFPFSIEEQLKRWW